MAILEKIVPQGSVKSNNSSVVYAERQMLDNYMSLDSVDDSSCETCNNCGSGDCSSCCGSTDD